ncbi:Crp/Fnr family transcriptional regulator [Paenisporosarcina quisquiliarum]|uniref:Crp/Fnr family transcriptional regulator n=1 Tax=Paenisporosarcina quisquiliarum TaxID=365346 RepID=A0A9X3LGY0_9BACL|nr:Crp/Fnr family transcriptional regulator [Paenisporosarcina quisquiliarum]MCZ8537772.1 Crp/Fnr family transcriptional regulator [Paenisporosarcina quisquiliarum]
MKEGMIDTSVELQELLSIRHSIKTYNKDSYLFQEGDPIKGIYFIRTGKVQIGKVTPEGRELTLRICGRNQFVGEFTLFAESAKYMLDAKVIEEVECIKISVEDLEEELTHNAKLAVTFMKWMGINHQKTQTKFRDLLLHGKKGALYSTLIRMTNSYGVPNEKGILIDMTLTNQELANFCGMTREVVNRLLSDLKKQDKLSMVDGKILIHDLDFLKDEINCEDCPIAFCKID